jgi:hypothetical protein
VKEPSVTRVQYLSEEFFQEFEKRAEVLPERPQINVTAQYVVKDVPDLGEVTYHLEFLSGRIARAALGSAENPDFTVTMGHKNAVKIQQAKLSPPVAFATGRVRATGNLGKLMKMLPVLQSAEYQTVFKQMREITDY